MNLHYHGDRRLIKLQKKVNKALFGLRFIRACTTQALRKQLVEALIIPHFTNCSLVYLDLTSELKIHLQRLSNACIRYIYGLRKGVRITLYRNDLGWMRTETRRTYFMAPIMYKVMQLKEPSYLRALFQPYVSLRPTRGPKSHLRGPKFFPGAGCPIVELTPNLHS